jgi:transcriptional antiterminator RfaH
MSNWYCIYTKQKQEISICERLTPFADIECFSPKIEVEKTIRGKVSKTVEALFPCYIFLKMDFNKYCHMIKNTRGVKSVLGGRAGQPINVDAEIIETIKQTVQNQQVQKKETQFTEGDRVIVSGGVFATLEATILKEVRAQNRVLIMLNTIYQARLEINKNLLSIT